MKRQVNRGKTPSAQWERKKTWPKFLVRNSASGIFYARFKVEGKQVWRSLKTDKITKASTIVGDEVEKVRKMRKRGDGRITLKKALAIHLERIENDPTKKDRTAEYHREAIVAIGKTWPDKLVTPIGKVTSDDCRKWAKAHSVYSASVFNKALGILRKAMAIGIEHGARIDDPFVGEDGKPVVERRKETPKPLKLPEPDQFAKFVREIETAGGRDSRNCARLVRFLAYGGFRIGEAAGVLRRDVNRKKGTITVWGGKGREEDEWRLVPIIPDMAKLLNEIRKLNPWAATTEPLMQVRECQKAMDRAAKRIGMVRITHHDLRHLFATRCIESGVDIPTVARWMGHKDGGALAMKVYGHLRDQHSAAMAQKVSFGGLQ